MSAAPLTLARGNELARDWIDAWNAHDLDAIAGLYAPAVEFQTPTIIDTLGIPDGRVRGIDTLREHFARGLARLPELHFDLDRVYVGVRSLAIAYRWHDGTPVCELHAYDDDDQIASVQALYERLDW